MDGVGEADHEEAFLAGIVEPIVVALESEVVGFEEEAQRTVVTVFHFETDTIAHGERLRDDILAGRGVVAVIGRHLAEELRVEVEEEFVVVVETDVEMSVERRMVEARQFVAANGTTFIVGATYDNREHLIIDEREVAFEHELVERLVLWHEDIVECETRVTLESEIVIIEVVGGFEVEVELAAELVVELAEEHILLYGAEVVAEDGIGVEQTGAVPGVGTVLACDAGTDDEGIMKEMTRSSHVGEEMSPHGMGMGVAVESDTETGMKVNLDKGERDVGIDFEKGARLRLGRDDKATLIAQGHLLSSETVDEHIAFEAESQKRREGVGESDRMGSLECYARVELVLTMVGPEVVDLDIGIGGPERLFGGQEFEGGIPADKVIGGAVVLGGDVVTRIDGVKIVVEREVVETVVEVEVVLVGEVGVEMDSVVLVVAAKEGHVGEREIVWSIVAFWDVLSADGAPRRMMREGGAIGEVLVGSRIVVGFKERRPIVAKAHTDVVVVEARTGFGDDAGGLDARRSEERGQASCLDTI